MTALICIIVMNAMLVLTYALQVSQVTYGAKRIARMVEITGYATPNDPFLKEKAKELIPNFDALGAKIYLKDPDYSEGGGGIYGKIQVRHGFTVVVEGTYKLKLLNVGETQTFDLPLPVYVSVSGRSERYWTT